MSKYDICGNPAVRHDFILLFDVTDGNPNGDPDSGNMPRIDPETMQGLVTDVCLKRKIRNYVDVVKSDAEGYSIFIREKAVLNTLISGAYDELGIDLSTKPINKKDGKERTAKGKAQGSEVESARQLLCKKNFDVRMFGAVLMTGANAGQVRGPAQLTFARSVDPIVLLSVQFSRKNKVTPSDPLGTSRIFHQWGGISFLMFSPTSKTI